MSALQTLKSWVGGLTELVLMLLALGIAVALLVGGQNLPFFGDVAGNIVKFVQALGSAGLAGLIALGVILWLFSNRNMS
jgi:hypothetical protein